MITLDLNLPSMDGMAVCREIRKVSANVPIIMLTARDSESDQVIGLEMGADDYVTKPLSPLTLIARMIAKKPRQVFSREQLLELVWDYQYFGDERTVDAHIKKLRQKIEKVGPQVIQTVWGVGYKFDDSGVA